MNQIDRRPVQAALIFLAFGTIAGAALDATGVTPWLLIFCTASAVVVALRQRLQWVIAIAGAVVLLLSADLMCVRLLQPIDVGLDLKNRVVLVVISATAWGVLWRNRRTVRPLTLPALPPLSAALAPTVVATVGAVIAVSLLGSSRVAWSMQNDAVWNTVTARYLFSDRGIGVGHSFVSPLVQTLLAGAFAPGRNTISPAQLLEHDVTRQAELWLLMMGTASVLAGLIAWRGFVRWRVVPRSVGTFAVACIPLSWFAAGYSLEFGFFNATLVLIALLCGWIAWSVGDTHRLAAIIVMSGVTLVTLGTWAPVAVVPISLGVGLLVLGSNHWWRALRGRRMAALVVSLVAVPAYVVGFTLPDIVRESKALSANGGMVALEPFAILSVVAVALVSTALVAFLGTDTVVRPFIGVVLVVSSSAVSLGYLVVQRTGESSGWGYYPQKLSWIVAQLLIIVIAVSIPVISPLRAGARRALVATACVVTVLLMCLPLPTKASIFLVASAFLPVPQVFTTATTARIFSAADREHFTVFARYGSAEEDSFVNLWLVQLRATSGLDPVRAFAYSLDGADPVRLCRLAEAASEQLFVRTADRSLASEIHSACPSDRIAVALG